MFLFKIFEKVPGNKFGKLGNKAPLVMLIGPFSVSRRDSSNHLLEQERQQNQRN